MYLLFINLPRILCQNLCHQIVRFYFYSQLIDFKQFSSIHHIFRAQWAMPWKTYKLVSRGTVTKLLLCTIKSPDFLLSIDQRRLLNLFHHNQESQTSKRRATHSTESRLKGNYSNRKTLTFTGFKTDHTILVLWQRKCCVNGKHEIGMRKLCKC